MEAPGNPGSTGGERHGWGTGEGTGECSRQREHCDRGTGERCFFFKRIYEKHQAGAREPLGMYEGMRALWARIWRHFAQVHTMACLPWLSDHSTALSPHTRCCWHCIPTMTNDMRPQKAITMLSFRDQPRSLSFRYTVTFISNLSVTSKPITLEFHSHSSLSGFPVFEVFNSHLGTIWRMYSCYSDLSNAPSRERPDWNSIQFCSIFSLRFNIGLRNIFVDHNL